MADERIAIKYRPHSLTEMRGQDENRRILRQQINSGNLPKAMLFWGIRGTGKTTTARMIAEWVNCEEPTEEGPCGCCRHCTAIRAGSSFDVIELDAASNNKVEDMLKLLKEIEPMPAQMKKRVVILDEVHRLSKDAFSVLLKTLEEPPEHVIFIFCTTEREKIPKAVLSRLIQYEYRTLDLKIIASYLVEVAGKEGVTLEADASATIASLSGGSMRDALTMLQAFMSEKVVTDKMVRLMYGISSVEETLTVATAIAESNTAVVLSYIEDMTVNELRNLINAVIGVFLNVLYYRIAGKLPDGETFAEGVKAIDSDEVSINTIIKKLAPISVMENDSVMKASLLSVVSKTTEDTIIETLTEKLRLLEERLSSLESGKVVVKEVVTPETEPVAPVNAEVTVAEPTTVETEVKEVVTNPSDNDEDAVADTSVEEEKPLKMGQALSLSDLKKSLLKTPGKEEKSEEPKEVVSVPDAPKVVAEEETDELDAELFDDDFPGWL